MDEVVHSSPLTPYRKQMPEKCLQTDLYTALHMATSFRHIKQNHLMLVHKRSFMMINHPINQQPLHSWAPVAQHKNAIR